jgi:hypothetical protein
MFTEILRTFNTSRRSVKTISKGLNIINEFLGFEDGKDGLRKIINGANLLHTAITQKSQPC